MTGTFQPAQVAAYFSTTASTPGFWSPIELSIPPGVSVTRGGTLPMRGLSVVPLQQIAPRRSTSTTSPYSIPYPNVPDATRIGFGRINPRPRSTLRSRSTGGAAVVVGGATRVVAAPTCRCCVAGTMADRTRRTVGVRFDPAALAPD